MSLTIIFLIVYLINISNKSFFQKILSFFINKTHINDHLVFIFTYLRTSSKLANVKYLLVEKFMTDFRFSNLDFPIKDKFKKLYKAQPNYLLNILCSKFQCSYQF